MFTRSNRLPVAIVITAIFLFVAYTGFAQSKPAAAKKPSPLPAGTYFIVNVSNGEAITASNASSGQNVLLFDFTKEETQRWTVIPKNNKYIIQLSGFPDLLLQTHPSVRDHTPIISLPGLGKDRFTIEPAGKGQWVIKNQNGSPMYAYETSTDKELRFGPHSKDNTKQFWEFKPVQ